MKIVILGGSGQIGKHLFKKFTENNSHEVYAVCRSKESAFLIRDISNNIIIGNVEDPEFCIEVLSQFNIIINSAVASGSAYSLSNNNMNICKNLANIVSKYQNIYVIHFSSLMIYKNLLKVESKYFNNPKPSSFYGYTKYQSEKILLNTQLKLGSKIFILRLGHVYGPSLMQSKVSIDYILSNLNLPFDGLKFSNCIHIEYLYNTLVNLIEDNYEGGIYNSINYPNNTWREIMDWHSNACDLPKMLDANMIINKKLEYLINHQRSDNLIIKLIRSFKDVLSQFPFLMAKSLGDASGYFLSIAPKSIFERIKRKYVNHNFKKSINMEYSISNDHIFLATESVPGRILKATSFNVEELNSTKILKEMRDWYLESQKTI